MEIDTTSERQFLTFTLQNEEFGIEILQVRKSKDFPRSHPYQTRQDLFVG